MGFVGFEFYSVFPGQSEYVHNSSLELLDGDLEFWILTDHTWLLLVELLYLQVL